MIRIGANPIIWSNDDLKEIGGDITLETCLRNAKQAGVEGMELGKKFPREISTLSATLAPYGLACIGGWHSIKLLERPAAEEFEGSLKHRTLLKGMGTDVFIVAEVSNTIQGDRAMPQSKRPHMKADEWVTYGKKMTDFANMLAAEGFKLCYHHHMGGIVESRADIGNFMDHTGASVNLLFDTGHLTWAGCDPVEVARTYKTRISHIHCKDVRLDIMAKSKAGDWSFLDSIVGMGDEIGIFTIPGRGSVDYVNVFKELAGYSGWVVLEAEQDPKKADPLENAIHGVANLKRFLTEAGLK